MTLFLLRALHLVLDTSCREFSMPLEPESSKSFQPKQVGLRSARRGWEAQTSTVGVLGSPSWENF